MDPSQIDVWIFRGFELKNPLIHNRTLDSDRKVGQKNTYTHTKMSTSDDIIIITPECCSEYARQVGSVVTTFV